MFLRNKNLSFLIDKYKKILPSPVVVYYGNHYNKILSVSVFGVPKGHLLNRLMDHFTIIQVLILL